MSSDAESGVKKKKCKFLHKIIGLERYTYTFICLSASLSTSTFSYKRWYDENRRHSSELNEGVDDDTMYNYEEINHLKPTRINVSMSLYQILDVNWFDEFLDWDPREYGMLNKTIVPYDQIWIPDTYLYN
ncbi:hypothetical protein OSTOST_15474, partial [Ostertagia ostertagi]